MGLLRGGLLTFVSILLFLSLFAMNSTWTISMSLKYDNIKTELIPVISDIIRNQSTIAEEMDVAVEGMQIICLENVEVVQKFGEDTYTFPCEVVNQGSEAVITYAITSLVEDKYYQEYDCNFWECSYTPPYHLVSAKAQSYWGGWFYWSLLLSLVLAAVIFFLVENKNNFPFVVGGLLVISALPFAKVSWLLSLLGYWDFLQFFVLFFSKATTVFLFSFITGIVLLGIGVVLKFLGIGKFIGGLFGGGKKGQVAIEKEESSESTQSLARKQEIKEENKQKKKSK